MTAPTRTALILLQSRHLSINGLFSNIIPPLQNTAAIEAYRFNEAADALYHFIWHSYCDWYVELIKPSLGTDDSALAAEIKATASAILAVHYVSTHLCRI